MVYASKDPRRRSARLGRFSRTARRRETKGVDEGYNEGFNMWVVWGTGVSSPMISRNLPR